MHADTWIKQLGKGDETSHARMQSALNEAFPLALGIFEPAGFENELKESEIFAGEEAIQALWLKAIEPVLTAANLRMPDLNTTTPAFGGRKGYHTEFLQPLLDEMCEVFRIDPAAEW
jgi:ring-1,2-phenylacetyl-CoA epoxidase subunit PaaC